MKMARVGVLLDRAFADKRWSHGMNVFEGYVTEVLAHAGIPFRETASTAEIGRDRFDVVIVALAEETEENASRLLSFAEQGGVVIGYAGLNKLAGKLGCVERPSVAPGYAFLPDADVPLRFLHARPWLVEEEKTGSASGTGYLRKDSPNGAKSGAALLRFPVGEGFVDRWAVDIPGTIVGLQQGTAPVWEDGVPARDGSGEVAEGILKADDRCEMDWELDRLKTETGAPYFAHPYADYWREALLSHLLGRVVGMGLTLPFLGPWPEGVPHVAMISHDSDINQDVHAEAALDVLQECGIQSTWCMIEPGYSPSIYERVKEAGHELAFHYNALDQQDGRWGADEFARQFDWLKKATGLQKVTSNKNHYTRFEGWGELFRFCETHGIEAEQTRGPSKKGNIGFLFGTAQPYFPIAWSDERNRYYDVLVVGFLTQDLDHRHLADSSVAEPFLDGVMRVEGVAHFLFHQVHIKEQPMVTDAVRKVVREARKRGFVFWTCKQINDWVRARRRVAIRDVDASGLVIVDNAAGLENVVVWVPVDAEEAANGPTELKFGIPCRKQIVTKQTVSA
ncbi:hypothetical protein J31TS4_30830 [Paenibacillus sp. J31TS4]|uniref:hypothetical protein n=1 Tax=Paenibacillus sp. J31TS4 TaxID=2807195 RepID=UPI001B15B38A|nr:hypothetical protein [Paenibacillus sp. J31TS4]GIP39803.1 hypothetical protein J31TS4_30830 [Paenibacillus sp. J31TS4]